MQTHLYDMGEQTTVCGVAGMLRQHGTCTRLHSALQVRVIVRAGATCRYCNGTAAPRSGNHTNNSNNRFGRKGKGR